MKPKLALFVSIALTAFVVVILTGVINQVKETTTPVEKVVQVEPTTETTLTPTATLVPTPQLPSLTPEQAANMAAQIFNRQDLFSVETLTIAGVVTYKVTFSNGDIVNMGQDGQVLSVVIQPLPTNVAANINSGSQNNGGSGVHSPYQESGNPGSDDDGDEHEGGEED